MEPEVKANFENFVIPDLIMSVTDVTRLQRELAALDDYLRQISLRHQSQTVVKLPKTSRLVDDLALINKIDLLVQDQRQQLSNFLKVIMTTAPIVHISFAVDPSSAFLIKIIQWFRRNINQYILLQVGLEPNIAAGCVVRTTNQYHDFSLRAYFKAHQAELVSVLGGGIK